MEWHSAQAVDRSWTGRSWPEDGGKRKKFTHSTHTYLRCTGVPGTVLGPRDITVTKTQPCSPGA